MKAAILKEIGKPLSVEDIDVPSLLQTGQVLVRMLCTGICGAQLQEIDGEKGDPSHLQHLLGHEGCGIVEATGTYPPSFNRGDKVVLHWRRGAGREPNLPARYALGKYLIKSGTITTFSEFSIVSETHVTKIPNEVPSELASLMGCALSTALSVVEKEVQWGKSVLVAGCGGVGLAMIFAAKLANAYPIFASDTYDSKRELAESLGAIFNYPVPIRERFDVIIDTTGSGAAAGTLVQLLAPSGSYIIVGQPGHRDSIDIWHPKRLFEGEGKTIKATQAGGFNPSIDIPRYVGLWRSGALNGWEKLITHRKSIYEINDGIELMRQGRAGRVIIQMPINSEKGGGSKPNAHHSALVTTGAESNCKLGCFI